MNNFLLWIGALLTLCLGALFAVPHFVDWNRYRGVIEEEASRYFGRRVRVGGEVNLRVLPVPYVSFDKLSVADTSTARGGPIFRAENFKLWLSVPPLLQGIVEAHHVELKRPVVELAIQDDGSGNWQDLRLNTGSLSFVPVGFALESLDVIDGEVVLSRGANTPLTRFEKINGSLSAPALQGPYKFNGTFHWRDVQRSLRLATGRPMANGDVRLKASLSNTGAQRSALLDGTFSTTQGRPAFKGNVTATLANVSAFTRDTAATAKPEDSSRHAQSFDFRSELALDTKSVRFDAINLALQTDGPPQIMTGDATVKWSDGVAVKVDLNSRWIDFDRFTVSAEKAAPFDNARQMLVALGQNLPDAADTNVRIGFDQATLGGQALGAIQLVAVRKSGPLKVQEFEANVPGGGKVALSGALTVSQADPGFRGRIFAEGNSLTRFLNWGFGNDTFTRELRDGAFTIESDLALSEAGFSLANARLDFGDGEVHGDLRMRLAAPRSTTVQLSGHKIDWGRLSPDPFGLGLIQSLDAAGDPAAAQSNKPNSDPTTATEPPSHPRAFAGLAGRGDLDVTIKTANLVVGDDVYHDFEGRLETKAGAIAVPKLTFRKDSGLKVDLRGRAPHVPGGDADTKSSEQPGRVKGVIEARSHVAIADLLQFLGIKSFDPVLRNRLAALAPIRVAHVYEFGHAETSPAQLRIDGTALEGRIVADVHLAKGLKNWRKNLVRVSGEIENQSTPRLLSLISESRTLARWRGPNITPARLHFHGEGVPSQRVLTRAVLNSKDLSLNYYGNFVLNAGDPLAFDGTVDVDTPRLGREVLAVLGLELGSSLKGTSIAGKFDVVRKDSTTRLSAKNVVLNGSRFSGLVTLTEQTNAPAKLVANLGVDTASLPGLMNVILAPKNMEASELPTKTPPTTDQPNLKKVAFSPPRDQASPEKQSSTVIWPEQNFDLTPLGNVEGYVTANFKTLSLARDGGLALSNAKLEAGLRPNELRLSSLTGEALGGTATATAVIKKAAAGVDLDGEMTMNIGKAPSPVSKTKGADDDSQTGPAHAAVFKLSFQSRAFSPRGLASDLDGNGELVLANASLTGLTAKEVRQAAKDALATEGPVDSEAFVEKLKSLLKQGEIKLGSLKIPVELKDGSLSMAPIELSGDDGVTTFQSSLRVPTMQFDSAWQIAAKLPTDGASAKPGATLPPIKVRYLGSLADVATVDPELSTGALERELAVQKMERDVAELERLRKLDEARAKEEEERRRQLEARLAEQRRLQAERERQLLLEQQDQAQQLGPDGLPLSEPGQTGDGTVLPNGDTAEAAPEPPKPRRARKKRPPPKKDVWNPFQITPY